MKWPEGLDVYPKTLPPLRSDRDTVLVGSAKSTAAKQVEIDVDGPAGPQKLAWDIPEFKSDADNGYLVTLVDQAKVNGGRTLPLVDSASLATAKQEIVAGGRGLTDLASKALHAGNLESADKLAGEALNRNPNDLVARSIKDAIARKAAAPAGGPAGAAAKTGENAPVVSEPGDMNLQGGNDGVPRPDGAAAASQINEANALEEQWEKDVQNTINQARSQATVDPAKAAAMIQLKTNDLTAVNDLRPEMRERLMGMLHAASGEFKRRAEEFTAREQQRIREETARKEMEMTADALPQAQNKVKQLMDRYDSLMAEGRHRLAEESAVFEAEKVADQFVPSARPALRGRAGQSHHRRWTTSWRSASPSRRASSMPCIRPRSRTFLSPTSRPSSIRTPTPGRNLRSVAGKVQFHGTLETRPRRKEDPRGPQGAYPDRIRRDALEGRRRLPQGPAPHRDPTRCPGLERGGRGTGHAGDEEPQGHFAPLGLEAVAG